MQLKLSIAHNLEANGKIERNHLPNVQALIKACMRKPKFWPNYSYLLYGLTKLLTSLLLVYMFVEHVCGQKPIMLDEESILTWVFFHGKMVLDKEDF